MGKFLNSDYDEVTAYSQEELDAEIEKAKTEAKTEAQKEIEAKAKELDAKNSEYEKLSKKYDSRKDEYDNLKKKFEETSNTLNQKDTERKAAFENMRDSMIKKAAGDDKEYEEKLLEAYGRLGSETLDPNELEKQLKESHAIAMTHLERDFTPFNLGSGASGEAPRIKPDENKRFTDTDEGKNTLSHIMTSMGQDPSKINSEDKK